MSGTYDDEARRSMQAPSNSWMDWFKENKMMVIIVVIIIIVAVWYFYFRKSDEFGLDTTPTAPSRISVHKFRGAGVF